MPLQLLGVLALLIEAFEAQRQDQDSDELNDRIATLKSDA
jgi:hypothetical protein